MKRRVLIMMIVCIAVLALVFGGCSSSQDKEIDLPAGDSVQSIQLQFCDDSCTASEIVDIIDDNKSEITDLIRSSCGRWRESVNDNPQEVPYVILNIHTENQEDITVYVYKKNDKYYVEEPYAGVWTATEELYDMVYDYADSEEHNE